MSITIFLIILSIQISVFTNLHAEIITDSSFGQEQTIPLKDNTYSIEASYGQTHGGNLFHSFKTFNIEAGKIADFKGPSSVQNIISRVTGGEPSLINGTLKSEISGANLFLLNPNGIIFGELARLDIKGSFYASTSDYLQMEDGSKWMTSATDLPGLTLSPPQQFGFIDRNIAPITFNNLVTETSDPASSGQAADEIPPNFDNDVETNKPLDNAFAVQGSNDICIIGGEIIIKDGTILAIEDTPSIKRTDYRKGNIQLVSLKSKMNVLLDPSDMDWRHVDQLDHITIKDAVLNVSGNQCGGINIVGKDITLDNTMVFMDNYNTVSGNQLNIVGENLTMMRESQIVARTFSDDQAPNIKIDLRSDLKILGMRSDKKVSIISHSGTLLDKMSPKKGMTSFVEINARNFFLLDGAVISNFSYSRGDCQSVIINAEENIEISSPNNIEDPSAIYVKSLQKHKDSGKSGTIKLTAKNILLSEGAKLSASTYGGGKGGSIEFNADEDVTLKGIWRSKKGEGQTGCDIFVRSYCRLQGVQGHSGDVSINAKNIYLKDGASIKSETYSSGIGGTITLNASETISLEGIDGLKNSCSINSSAIQKGITYGDDPAGNINMTAQNIYLFHGASIKTQTENKGNAGKITIKASQTLKLSNQKPEAKNPSCAIVSSATETSSGNGGVIEIQAKNIQLLEGAYIQTGTASTGNAGEVYIHNTNNLTLSHSRIASESKMSMTGNQNGGAAGQIKIQTSGNLLLLESSRITTDAVSSGGGIIDIENGNALTLINSNVTTNVKQGEGNGGDINIKSNITALNHGIISANAEAGDGGAIYIYTHHLLKSPDSRIEATSERGNDGTVEIEVPSIEGIENLLNLSGNYLPSINIVKTLCENINEENTIKLVIDHPYAVSGQAADWYHLSTYATHLSTNFHFSNDFDSFSRDFTDEALFLTRD